MMNRLRSISSWWNFLAAFLLITVGASRPAQACGGFFCDRPGSGGQLPIAQSAENVLFVLDKDPQTGLGRVEAHIQIIYTGAADQFSWVVPVTATPTLDVGNDVLFDRLEPATRPRYQLKFSVEGSCQGFGGGTDDSFLPACGGSSVASAGNTSLPDGSGSAVTIPSVQVLFRGNVGPYDSAVIKSDDPTALEVWLKANGYFVSTDASRIIADYVAAQSSFVALRLRQGQDSTAIQPIILRFGADEGCLPLKLTAIAATPDVRINVWVLGGGRAVPINYTEIGLDFAKLDWFNGGKNYDQILGQAADEAGGNAFAVEDAQDAAGLIPLFNISPAIAELAAQPNPGAYLTRLFGMGFTPQGALLQVLRQDLPLPPELAAMGVTESDYYQNPYKFAFMSSGPDGGAGGSFDAKKLTDDLNQAVFIPLMKFAPLFENHRKLTRLATFISPDEMNTDPIFITSGDLPDVSANHLVSATILCGDGAFDTCHAPVRLQTDDGAQIVYPVAAGAPATCNPQMQPTYDRGDLDDLPGSTVGFARAPDSDGSISVDNRAAISAALAKHNAAAMTSAHGSNASGSSCSVTGRSRHSVLPLVALGVLAWAARRRRRRA
ncbi:MAG TPA: DUF2330 domain-containing protein [Polyangia bacterium]|jgi:hypothetical protein|nr:DUF2330 domain-containing protein [Polyangia bacterium]